MKWPLRQDTIFFPPVANPRACGHLDVGEGHQVWWELTGNPAGVPVVVVHGGPGGSIRPYYRRLIDPDRQQGVFFDQRGCGMSLPAGALDHNTTPDLVADMERLRAHLGFERWIVLGGSWGSTLALAYAEAHPERVAGLVVSGVYLARAFDVWWWWQGGGHVFPEVFAARDAWLPEAERSDPRNAFVRRILDPDPAIHRPAAHILGMAESQTLDLWPAAPGTTRPKSPMPPYDLPRFSRITRCMITSSHPINCCATQGVWRGSPGRLSPDAPTCARRRKARGIWRRHGLMRGYTSSLPPGIAGMTNSCAARSSPNWRG